MINKAEQMSQQQGMMNPMYDPQGNRSAESEFDLYDKMQTPTTKTSTDFMLTYDSVRKKYMLRGKHRGFQELNTPDLTNTNLDDKTNQFAYVWHTLVLLDRIELMEIETGYSIGEDIHRFLRNNMQLYASISKSRKGWMGTIHTTRQIAQSIDNRMTSTPMDEQGNPEERKNFMQCMFNR